MAEFLYATSHLGGSFTNPTNALGNTPTTWAGQLNSNSDAASRWAMGDPSGSLSGTQTIRVQARKGSNSGVPTISVELWENGSLISTIVNTTNITSTTGQTLTGTFSAGAISNPNNVEILVRMTAAGGSPSARNSAQISHIEWEAALGAVTKSGTAAVSVVVTGAAAGLRTGVGTAQVNVAASLSATGLRTALGSATVNSAISLSAAGLRTALGSAVSGISVSLSAAGQLHSSTLEGTAASGVTISLAATGQRTALGSAAVGVVATVSAAGLRTALQTAAISTAVSLAASGSKQGGGGGPGPGKKKQIVSGPGQMLVTGGS